MLLLIIIYLTKKEMDRMKLRQSPEYYHSGCIALKQYYALTIFDGKNMHAISSELDPFWHSHILDTVSYDLLCSDIGLFMHHDPLNKLDKTKVKAVKVIYDYTYKTLTKIFGKNNLAPKFHPSIATDATMVCLHDIDVSSRAIDYTDDQFPLNLDIYKLRTHYGHHARKAILQTALKEAL